MIDTGGPSGDGFRAEEDPAKAFPGVIRRERLRSIRRLARAALERYDIDPGRIRLLRHAGNTVFRVVETGRITGKTTGDVFVDGHYLLRVHQPGYQTRDAIALELEWLAALRRDAGAPVPEPVRTKEGGFLPEVTEPGLPGPRSCSLLRWVRGRRITRGIGPGHYRAQGRLMALLHNHAERWRLPEGHSKRRYDWNGLFRDDGGSGIPAREAWRWLPPAYVKPFELVAERVGEVMAELGDGPDVFGLIHGDLGVDANVIFRRGEARAIDFDDSGVGYWVYDLAVALEHCREDSAYPAYRGALLEGYTEDRPRAEPQLRHLELFLVGFQVYWSLWAAAMARVRPEHEEALFGRMKRSARLVSRYVAEN